MNVKADWHSVISGKLPDQMAAELAQKKKHFQSLPLKQWRTGDALPENPIAVLTDDGAVSFAETARRDSGEIVPFAVIREAIFASWGRRAVGWLPLGE